MVKNYRKIELEKGPGVILGKDEKGNDELMREYEGKENIIVHTSKPGSPFGVMENLNPNKKEIYEAAVAVAKHSQDWRDNKSGVSVDIFTGKNILKPRGYKPGTWKVRKKKTLKIKKEDILKFERNLEDGEKK